MDQLREEFEEELSEFRKMKWESMQSWLAALRRWWLTKMKEKSLLQPTATDLEWELISDTYWWRKVKNYPEEMTADDYLVNVLATEARASKMANWSGVGMLVVVQSQELAFKVPF
ncbi:unnamed protein product [Gongylonema pulchrum]|uniref:PH domain-containing protein n=1 Tax=Gongylonema pulchrum TaxID=637853 RepID=A0A183DWP3_9BILA|nr:unnamed protein product [Gongylonema pulchrum]